MPSTPPNCSGMLAKDTICAEMAFMFMERNKAGSTIDYPLGGSGRIVDSLLRGLNRHGGRLLLRARVADILLEGGGLPSVWGMAAYTGPGKGYGRHAGEGGYI